MLLLRRQFISRCAAGASALEHRLAEENNWANERGDYTDAAYDIDDDDDLTPDEQEAVEEKVVDHASAAATIAELEAEIKTLKRLEKMANDVRVSGVDRKWDELSSSASG